MEHVVCLIAQPERECLDHGLATKVARGLGGAPRWLAGDEACEIAVAGDPAAALARARADVAGRAIDVCAVPAADRIKRLLLSDLDS
ncbi:MAG: phosphoserine phosphatase SerB, partial [Myxococcota bacterium]